MRKFLLLTLITFVIMVTGCEKESSYNGTKVTYENSYGVATSASNDKDKITSYMEQGGVNLTIFYKDEWTKEVEDFTEKGLNQKEIVANFRSNSRSHFNDSSNKVIGWMKLNARKDIEYISSDFAPAIVIRYLDEDVNQINEDIESFSNLEFVEHVYVSCEVPFKDSGVYEDAFDLSNIDEVHNYVNPDYDGDGIRIGVWEALGYADLNYRELDNLTNAPFQREGVGDPGWALSSHTTWVASIIGGESGIAPESNLYIAKTEQDGVYEMVDSTNWFLEPSQDVHIINMSLILPSTCESVGVSSTSSYESLLNYIVRNSSVTIVASTGNNLDKVQNYYQNYVCSPAQTENVISVSAVESSGKPAQFANFKDDTIGSNPLITAKGEKVKVWYYPNDSQTAGISGTSFSAPIVTGVIALAMQGNNDLITHPELVMAAVATTANSSDPDLTNPDSIWIDHDNDGIEDMFEVYDYPNSQDSETGLWDRTGAGIIDAKKLIDGNWDYSNLSVTANSAIGTKWTKNIYLNAGDDLTITMAFLRNGTSSSSDSMRNYDIKIFNPWGLEVLSSSSDTSNVEMLHFNPSVSGTYTVKLVKVASFGTGIDKVSICILRE